MALAGYHAWTLGVISGSGVQFLDSGDVLGFCIHVRPAYFAYVLEVGQIQLIRSGPNLIY